MWHPTPVRLAGKSHGWRSLVGCSPQGHYESDMTKQLHFQFSLSYIGEGDGNTLQYSCMENPRNGGAWWAAIYGVTQNWTWLKRLSSSSSNSSSSRTGALVRACLMLSKAFFLFPSPKYCSVSGPLVASYRGLAISLNPIIPNSAKSCHEQESTKLYYSFFCLWVLRLNIACFLQGDNGVLPEFIIYLRYLICFFEICGSFWEVL